MVQSSCSGGRSPAGSALLEAAGVLVGGGVQSTSGAAGQLGGCLLANAGQRLRGLPPLHPGAGGQQLGSLPPRPTMAPRQPVSLERATSLYGRASGCHNAHYWCNGRAFRGLLGADRPDSHHSPRKLAHSSRALHAPSLRARRGWSRRRGARLGPPAPLRRELRFGGRLGHMTENPGRCIRTEAFCGRRILAGGRRWTPGRPPRCR